MKYSTLVLEALIILILYTLILAVPGDDIDNDYWGARTMCWNSLLLDRWGGGYTTIPEEHVIGV